MKDDLISKTAAIDAVHKNYDTILDFTSDGQTISFSIEDILSELPSTQPGWIPCSRELPKPNEEDGNGFHKAYLVQDGRWMDVACWNGKYWIAWGYSTVLLNVVAWMPLPTPYREGGQDGTD